MLLTKTLDCIRIGIFVVAANLLSNLDIVLSLIQIVSQSLWQTLGGDSGHKNKF